MYISQETPEQTQQRLQRVLADAQFEVFAGEYAFVERPVDAFPQDLLPHALAFIKDAQVWSALVPSTDPAAERFVVFSFHFVEGQDNSGFVGWLASHFKRTLGTGVFVVCGQNTQHGGIFDYWGAPISMAKPVIAAVEQLRAYP
jgi:hypothetical protein